MMMAELVQGQASVAQSGAKDDFADTIRRVRQVKMLSSEHKRAAFRSQTACVLVDPGWALVGAPCTTNTPHAASKLT